MALSKKVLIKYEVDQRSAKRGLDAMAKGTEKVRTSTASATAEVNKLNAATAKGRGKSAGLFQGLQTALNGPTGVILGLTAAAAAYNRWNSRIIDNVNVTTDFIGSLDEITAAMDNMTTAHDAAAGAALLQSTTLKLTQSQMNELAKLTATVADKNNKDLVTSWDAVSKAIAKGNVDRLRANGLNTDSAKLLDEVARATGRSTTQIGLAERQTIAYNEALRAMREQAEKAGAGQDGLAFSFERLKNKSIDSLDAIGRAINQLPIDLREFQDALKSTAEGALFDFGASSDGAKEAVNDTGEALSTTRDTMIAYATLGNSEVIPFLTNWSDHQKTLNGLLGNMPQINISRSGLGGISTALETATSKIREAEQAVKDVRSAEQIAGRVSPLFQGPSLEDAGPSRKRGKANKRARVEFQRQLTEAVNAERAREFAGASSLQRTFLADTAAFQAQLSEIQGPQNERARDAEANASRLAEIQERQFARNTELALAKATTDDQRNAIELRTFAHREEALQRQLDLETQVGERQNIQDGIDQVRHEKTLARIEQERAAREALAAKRRELIGSIDDLQKQSFLLAGNIASVAIKGDERNLKIQNGIKSAGLFASAAVVGAEAVGSFASGNFLKGAAQTAAAISMAVTAGKVASGNVRGGGGGSSTAGTATQFGSGQDSAPTAAFTVDRGAPISVRDEVEGNPNNTSQRGSKASSGNVIHINGLSVLGTVDDQSSLTIAKSIQRAQANLGA